MLSLRAAFAGLLTLAILFAPGCGNSLGTPQKVSGKVTVDDTPLANAIVTFVFNGEREAANKSYQTKTGASGEYEIPAVYPGEYTGTIADVGGMDPAGDPGNQPAIAAPMTPVDGDIKLKVEGAPVTFDIKMTKGK